MSVGASLLSSLAVVTGPLLFFHGFRAWRIQRLIEDTPTARIRSMAMGLVELNGHVEHRSRLSAPFSGRECAYWEIDIATRASSRNGRQSWNTVHRAISGNPFYLRDATGVALVYPQGADVRTSFAVEETTHGLGVPPLYMEYMEAKGLGLRTLWSLGPMRFRERTLEQGAIVYALGRAQPKAMAQSLSDETVTDSASTCTRSSPSIRRKGRTSETEPPMRVPTPRTSSRYPAHGRAESGENSGLSSSTRPCSSHSPLAARAIASGRKADNARRARRLRRPSANQGAPATTEAAASARPAALTGISKSGTMTPSHRHIPGNR